MGKFEILPVQNQHWRLLGVVGPGTRNAQCLWLHNRLKFNYRDSSCNTYLVRKQVHWKQWLSVVQLLKLRCSSFLKKSQQNCKSTVFNFITGGKQTWDKIDGLWIELRRCGGSRPHRRRLTWDASISHLLFQCFQLQFYFTSPLTHNKNYINGIAAVVIT